MRRCGEDPPSNRLARCASSAPVSAPDLAPSGAGGAGGHRRDRQPGVLTSGNINTILTSSAALALVVLAELLVIITGKFDLSLESIYGFAPAIGAMVVVPAASFGFGFELPTASAFSWCWWSAG